MKYLFYSALSIGAGGGFKSPGGSVWEQFLHCRLAVHGRREELPPAFSSCPRFVLCVLMADSTGGCYLRALLKAVKILAGGDLLNDSIATELRDVAGRFVLEKCILSWVSISLVEIEHPAKCKGIPFRSKLEYICQMAHKLTRLLILKLHLSLQFCVDLKRLIGNLTTEQRTECTPFYCRLCACSPFWVLLYMGNEKPKWSCCWPLIFLRY